MRKVSVKKNSRLFSAPVDKAKGKSPRIVSWFPVTQEQRDQFIQLTIRGSWLGIGALVLFWLIVRFVGPALGWWIPADLK
tara:strand:- start:227 stop:466 length:240 start_codon:yes stop_codon:yes gene_type:complete